MRAPGQKNGSREKREYLKISKMQVVKLTIRKIDNLKAPHDQSINHLGMADTRRMP